MDALRTGGAPRLQGLYRACAEGNGTGNPLADRGPNLFYSLVTDGAVFSTVRFSNTQIAGHGAQVRMAHPRHGSTDGANMS